MEGEHVSSLSEFETGKREPRLNQLRLLARALHRPLSYFLEEATPDEPPPVLWLERPPSEVAVELEARFRELITQYHNLEEWCDEHLECQLPQAGTDRTRMTYPAAEALARRFRLQFNLGDRPAFSLQSTLEEVCGVRIFCLAFDPTGTAACSLSEKLGAAILLNGGNKRWRRNFDLAHELFHLITWRVFRTGASATEPDEHEESLANAFAAHLLIPAEALRESISDAARAGGGLKHSDLFDVAKQFDVSVDALLWRMRSVYRRSEEDTRRDIEQCQSMRAPFEKRDDDAPPERPDRFRSLARKALQMGEMSTGRAAEYLGISRRGSHGPGKDRRPHGR